MLHESAADASIFERYTCADELKEMTAMAYAPNKVWSYNHHPRPFWRQGFCPGAALNQSQILRKMKNAVEKTNGEYKLLADSWSTMCDMQTCAMLSTSELMDPGWGRRSCLSTSLLHAEPTRYQIKKSGLLCVRHARCVLVKIIILVKSEGAKVKAHVINH